MVKVPVVSWQDYRWIHLTPPLSGEVLTWLKQEFDFSELDLEDCLEERRQRPKWEKYPKYNFFILHFPELDNQGRIKINQLNAFVGKKFLVTVSLGISMIDEWFRAAQSEKRKSRQWLSRGSAFLFYELADRLTDHSLTIVNQLSKQIDQIDQGMFSLERKIIDQISLMRRNLIVFNTTLKPMIRIFSELETTQITYLDGKLSEYWSNVGDHLKQIADLVADHSELLDGLADAFEGLLTHRTNQTMKVLTVFSVLLLPLTLMSGIMGMNVALPLAKNPGAFWWIMGGMGAATIFMLGFFRAKKWL